MLKAALACVGKYLKDSGIEHQLVESGLFKVNIVDQVLDGSNYARSVKGFFIMADTFERLQLIDFFKNYSGQKFEPELEILLTLQEAFAEGEFKQCKLFLNSFKKNSYELIKAIKNYAKSRSEDSPLYIITKVMNYRLIGILYF